jgi:acetolactate decarboxylase
MLNRLVIVAAVAAVVCACARKPLEVRVFGSLHAMMHEGATGPVVALSDATRGAHAYAIGALSELRGEVTIVDGDAWIAVAEEDGRVSTTRDAAGESAALLVATNVASWSETVVTADIAFADLDAAIERAALAAGRDLTRPLPVLVEGPLAELTSHVIDGRRLAPGGDHAAHAQASVRATQAHANGTLIGFFSKSHEGVFTHLGSFTHFHVVVPASGVSGHVDHVTIERGARLRFPRE